MNKKIFALPLLAISLSFTSCLDETPKDQIPESEIYDSANSLYVNTVASLYNYIGAHEEGEGLQGTCRGIYDYNTLTTDEAIIPIRGGNWYDGGLWENMYDHTWTATDTDLYNVWKYLYKVIVLSTKSLETIDQHKSLLNDQQRDEYKAEVRAVRAMFYYYAMDMFGRIPILESSTQKTADIRQSNRSDVFKYIVNELQTVAPLLPNEHSNLQGNYYGRVTRPVAWFLLAKLALNAEVYTDDNWTDSYRPDGKTIMIDVDGTQKNAWLTCIHYCNLIASAGYSLASDYTKNFAVHNENSNENIFTIPLDKMLYLNEFHYLFRSRHYAHGGAYGGASENGTCATLHTMAVYGYNTSSPDARLDMNFYTGKVEVDGSNVTLDDGTPLEYKPLAVERNLTSSQYIETAGARMKKYEVDRTAYSDGRMPDNDIVLYRYADVMLMKAEAKVRNGESGDEELNAVRNRVGMPSLPATLDNILNERLLELVWEGWRRQDMIRFGTYNKSYDIHTPSEADNKGYTTVFPIPGKARELNPNLEQNPGY
ncbi:RagB/SusD family nutrient uptake outer membrane protein [uncultured Prevotella sp.]|uniref:RagB/SusD family nutrient uptake outer membrane protein n=1 Tax=uncultured Prevotella sp. TaxID=159272 RepID=UPI0025F002D0|nr:RagB/SusD family nutrient uptake outer membrane protein [uncultured Prevotella sp.]